MCNVHLIIYEVVVPLVVAPRILGVPCGARRLVFPKPSVPLPAPLVFVVGMILCWEGALWGSFNAPVLAFTRSSCL